MRSVYVGLCRKGSEGIQRTGAAQHLLKPFSLQYLQSLRRRRVQFLGRLLLHGGTDPVIEGLERVLVDYIKLISYEAHTDTHALM